MLRDGDLWRMWFGFVVDDGRYRIGYAESGDGVEWTRADEIGGLGPAGTDWESEAVSYPWVLRHDGRLHLLYNGNGFGRDGFGLAVEGDAS